MQLRIARSSIESRLKRAKDCSDLSANNPNNLFRLLGVFVPIGTQSLDISFWSDELKAMTASSHLASG